MSAIRLKICGITSLEDARAAIECGAQYLGFNFYRKSPRYIEPEAASALIKQLPDEIVTVGIFVNEDAPKDVVDILQVAGVQMAQLHGDEDAAYCAAVGAERVIKALRAGKGFDPQQVLNYPAAAILLDAFDKNLYGGTGKTANWAVAAQVAKLTQLFLAGGLSPENIVEAMQAVQPFAVDVNSGVESAPGKKDAARLQRLKEEMETIQ